MFGSESADISLQSAKKLFCGKNLLDINYSRRDEPSLQLQSVGESSMNLLFFGFVLL